MKRDQPVPVLLLTLLLLPGVLTPFIGCRTDDSDRAWSPEIPRIWDDAVMANLELPLAHPPASPKHVSSNYYYRIPVRPIFKSYPVYHPDREPPGYLERLRWRTPEVA